MQLDTRTGKRVIAALVKILIVGTLMLKLAPVMLDVIAQVLRPG